MLISLSAKNKLKIVNGSLEIPHITSSDYSFWQRCNDLVISWLLANLDNTIKKSVLFFNTAAEI